MTITTSIDTIVQQAMLNSKTLPATAQQAQYAALGQSNATLTRSQNAKQLYDGTGYSDSTEVKIPLIYGEVYTKGSVVDTAKTTNPNESKITQTTQKLIMSEGPCKGLVANPYKSMAVVVNGIPLVDPQTGKRSRAGVEVVDGYNRTDYTVKMSDVVPANGTTSLQVYESIYGADGINVDNSIAKNSLRALNDVVADTAKTGHVLQYDKNSKSWQSKHINEIIRNTGLYASTDPVPALYNTGSYELDWFLPHTTTLTFTSGAGRTQASGPYRWYRNPDNVSSNALHVNGLIMPDIVMYTEVNYQFDLSALSGSWVFKIYKPTGPTATKTLYQINCGGVWETYILAADKGLGYYDVIIGGDTVLQGGRILIK